MRRVSEQVLHGLHQAFICRLVNHERELVNEVSEILLEQQIQGAFLTELGELAVLLPKETEADSFALEQVVHLDQQPLLLYLLY
jgi:hypothetical protein